MSKGSKKEKKTKDKAKVMQLLKKRERERETSGEPTSRCHQNPFIGALGIQEPVIPGEPLIKS